VDRPLALDRPSPFVLPFADVAKRFFAAVIDGVFLGVFNGLVYMILFTARIDFNAPEMVLDLIALAVAVLSGWLYAALWESGRGRATLGKRAMGIKVTDLQGQRISFLKATGRHFGKVVSALPCFVGFIIAAAHPKRQAVHDVLAGTLVLDAK
jgi:uncharacterized RDD family membrane protein YckC